MSVPRSRVLDLMKVQSRIFGTIYNPQGLRTGNKVLRQRLKGPQVAAYYPRRTVTIKDLQKVFWKKFELETWDDDEEDRLDALAVTKQRGKGAPKKKRTKEESKKFAGKKKKQAAVEAGKDSSF
ncbi:mitochondral 37S ribosomal protein S27 [Bachmanniomyces sp. S44760]|nr:mitochondral 37S ribosomal protein S27 [Bachmanniomyces sp. S44760]